MDSLQGTSYLIVRYKVLIFRHLANTSSDLTCLRAEDPSNVVITSSIVNQDLTEGTSQGSFVQVGEEA